jgi:conserved hypothetical protein
MESFSHKAKMQICTKNENKDCCETAELLGLICFAGIVVELPNRENLGLKIILETEEVAERICLHLGKLCNISPEVVLKNNQATLRLKDESSVERLKEKLFLCEEDGVFYFRIDKRLVQSECCKKALIRGAFLGGGSIINPKKSYHLEFATRSYECAERLIEIVSHFGITPKLTTRKNEVLVYLKGSEEIADLMALIGANTAFMELYNTMIEKDMRNTINRQVNCENANMTKTANAAAKQMIAIDKISKLKGLDYLEDPLREIAILRMDYPEANLKELGEMLSTPIGKSGANHRLNKILEIAESI